MDKKTFSSRPALAMMDLTALDAPPPPRNTPGTQLTRAQHRLRIAAWRQGALINPDATDFETVTSALVTEGVRTLNNWDREMHYLRNVEEDRVRNTEDHDHIQDRHPSEDIAARDQERTELVADLRRIRKMVDPGDHITPRIMVSEFEKYMTQKRKGVATPWNSGPNPGVAIQTEIPPPKRVQFPDKTITSLPAPSAADKPLPPHQAAIVEWLKSPERPDLRLERPGALSKRFKTTEEKPSPSPRDKALNKVWTPPQPRPAPPTPTGVTTSFGTGPKVRGPDPDWWRRKIRQGMMTTEMLLGELVRQRRDDERTFQSAPYPFSHIAHIPPTFHHRGTSAERARLEAGLSESRRLHEKCFGSCPNSEGTSATGPPPPPTRTSVLVHAGHSRKSRDLDISDLEQDPDPISAVILSTPKLKNSGRRAAGNFKQEHPPPKADNDVKILFDRMHTFQTVDGTKTGPPSTENRGAGPSTTGAIPTPPPPQIISQAREQTAKNLNQFRAKPLIVLDNKKAIDHKERLNKEWVNRIVAAQKAHETKDVTAAKKRLENQRQATNALYSELRQNKARLTNEVNMEKRKMSQNWKGQPPIQSRTSSEDTLHLGRHPGSSRPRSRSRPSSKPRSRPATSHAPQYLQNLDPTEGKKAPQAFPRWKEAPRGLSLWLENVVSQAKDQEDRATKKQRKLEAAEAERHRQKQKISILHAGWAPLPKSRDQF